MTASPGASAQWAPRTWEHQSGWALMSTPELMPVHDSQIQQPHDPPPGHAVRSTALWPNGPTSLIMHCELKYSDQRTHTLVMKCEVKYSDPMDPTIGHAVQSKTLWSYQIEWDGWTNTFRTKKYLQANKTKCMVRITTCWLQFFFIFVDCMD